MSVEGGSLEVGRTVIHPVQERTVPEYNAIEKINLLLYALGNVTKRSRRDGIERPLPDRTRRAQLYHELHSPTGRSRQEIIEEVKARDEILQQYLKQGTVAVDFPDAGRQSTRYVEMTPPESRKTAETDTRPPIIFIPGIANDIGCVASLIQEISYQGRKIIAVGHPEGFMGTVTDKYVDKITEAPGYAAQAQFFKEAINSLVGPNKEVELWGFSTGAAIIAEIQTDPKFQSRTKNAVMIAPPSTVDQSMKEVSLGLAQETAQLMKRIGDTLGNYVFTQGRARSLPPEGQGQRKIKGQMLNAVLEKVRQKSDIFKKARVAEGGNIVVVTYGNDELSRSYKNNATFEADNLQMKLVAFDEGIHNTPMLKPAETVARIFEAQKKLA